MFAVLAGLGILTMALFPFALPGLLLFVAAPLILVAVVGVLLAIPLVVPLWLFRMLRRLPKRAPERRLGGGAERNGLGTQGHGGEGPRDRRGGLGSVCA